MFARSSILRHRFQLAQNVVLIDAVQCAWFVWKLLKSTMTKTLQEEKSWLHNPKLFSRKKLSNLRRVGTKFPRFSRWNFPRNGRPSNVTYIKIFRFVNFWLPQLKLHFKCGRRCGERCFRQLLKRNRSESNLSETVKLMVRVADVFHLYFSFQENAILFSYAKFLLYYLRWSFYKTNLV